MSKPASEMSELSESSPPPDHAHRQCALDIRRSFIVQAPAGSGKTTLLVRRYLNLLARVEAPEQILAITFTKKATAEMRARICNALNREQQNGEPEDDPDLLAAVAAVHANNAKHNWQLSDNLRRLRIHTIDAFCNELVCRMPWSARFGAPPAIVEDPAPLYQRAAKRALEHIEQRDEWTPAARQLLALVAADWNQAIALLTNMLAKRDLWMRILGQSHATDRAQFESMWQRHINAELEKVRALLPPAMQTELLSLARFAAEHLPESSESSASSESPKLPTQNFPPATHRHISQWHFLAELLLTQKGTLRKLVTKNQGFPVDSSAHKKVKARMLALLETIAAQPQLQNAWRAIRILPPAVFSDAQWESLAALMQLLRLAAGELRLLFKEQNQADYIELTQRAVMALGEAHAPSDLALAFDYRLAHLLVDEFQDTSTAHLDLLTRLTAGWQRDEWRTVFFVGDPMQSIYRFREAEVGNFLHVWERQQFGELAVQKIRLTSNFRSAAPLVNWFNDTFFAVMPRRNEPSQSAVKYARAQAVGAPDESTRVHIHAALKSARHPAAEAAAIAALIQQLQAQNPTHRIAVLGRARAHLHDLAAALRQREIPFQAIELEALGERLAIRDLLSLTRALLQPADRIAWLSLLRAPWCGLRLADLAMLTAVGEDSSPRLKPAGAGLTERGNDGELESARGDDGKSESATNLQPHATILELWQDPAVLARLSESAQTALARLRAALAPALHQQGRIPLRRNVEGAWLAVGGPATVSQSDLQDCQRYFELLSQMESDNREITAATLRQACEQLWAQGGAATTATETTTVAGAAAVQLLTIHKAKGLEFDHVILPNLHRPTRGHEKPLLRWRNLPDQLLLAPLPDSATATTGRGPPDMFYCYLAELEKIHHRNEDARVLYVACTRARHSLHLFGAARYDRHKDVISTPAEASFLGLLWQRVQPDFAAAAEFAAHTEAETETETKAAADSQTLQKLPADWTLPKLPPTLPLPATTAAVQKQSETIEFFWAGDSARIVGIVLHHILQQVAHTDWQGWCRQKITAQQKQHWRNQLAHHGMPADQLKSGLRQVVEAVQKAQRDPRAAWIFSPTNHRVKTEWAVSGVVDGQIVHTRIDRSFITPDGVCWIVDFKSSRHQGGDATEFLDREQDRHQPQMARYAAVVKQLRAEDEKATATETETKQSAGEIRLGLYFPALQGWREWSA